MNAGSNNEQIFLKGEEMQLSRKEREYQTHRKEILSAAEGVFAEKGFFSSTMSEIAERAEFGTGTLYKYFKSKDDLYLPSSMKNGCDQRSGSKLAGRLFCGKNSKGVGSRFEFVEKNEDFSGYTSERSRFSGRER
jgi:TetR/AcrR family fatty acid metabolism transcriptional regulator